MTRSPALTRRKILPFAPSAVSTSGTDAGTPIVGVLNTNADHQEVSEQFSRMIDSDVTHERAQMLFSALQTRPTASQVWRNFTAHEIDLMVACVHARGLVCV